MLIALIAVHPYPSPQAVPLANACLQSYLNTPSGSDLPVRVTLLDFYLHQAATGCAAGIMDRNPDAVAFSIYVWNRERSIEIAAELRRMHPGVVLFAGGPEVTADPGGVLADSPFDFVIAGEGEEPFAAVCARLAAGRTVSDIPGVATRGTDSLLLSPHQPLPDLDSIPSPWLTGVLPAQHYRGILWQLSRGCGFSCDFCFDSRGSAGVRRFSLERIEAELRHFADAGVSQVFVLDSTFNQDVTRAKTILKMIRRIAPGIHFHFEARSEFIDREMARLFGEITCSLQIGLQSSDPLVMKEVGRSFDRRDFVARVALLNESGATFGFDLMYGLPGDSIHGFRESIDFALGLYPNHLDIFPLAVLPGTALADRSSAIGLAHLPVPPYTLLSSPTFSAGDMGEAQRLANACDIFYTRGKAVAWFRSVVSALGQKPAEFLVRFADWLAAEKGAAIAEADLNDDEIHLLQRNYLIALFTPKRLKRLLPLVLDLVDYHHYYAAALLIPAPDLPDERTVETLPLLDLPARLAPSTRLAQFHYEILDILEAGEPDIRTFSDQFRQSGSWAVIYPGRDGIASESLIKPYFRLLELQDSLTPCGTLSARLKIPADEALSFLQFAAAEGILLFSPP